MTKKSKTLQEHAGISFRWGIPWGEDGFTSFPNYFSRFYSKLMLPRPDRKGVPQPDSPMKPAEFMFIHHLSTYHYESPAGESHPSLKTIAREMGMKAISVYRYKRALENAGLLKITYRDHDTSIYDLYPFAAALRALWKADTKAKQQGAGKSDHVRSTS